MKRKFYLGLSFILTILVSCDSNETKESIVEESSKTTKESQPLDPETKAEAKEQSIKWPKRDHVKEFFMEFGLENPESKVLLKTRLGEIEVQLFEDTPIHRANFIHHIKRGLYDKTIFYRVVPNFMIQGGNSDNDQTLERRKGVDAYYIPSEVSDQHIHERGTVAMAMSYVNNPEGKSAQYSYYIVIGDRFTDSGLDAVEEEYDITIPQSARQVYKSIGGTPHLDGKHTVFGKVTRGMDVVEAIANEDRDTGDWPITDVVIDYEILE